MRYVVTTEGLMAGVRATTSTGPALSGQARRRGHLVANALGHPRPDADHRVWSARGACPRVANPCGRWCLGGHRPRRADAGDLRTAVVPGLGWNHSRPSRRAQRRIGTCLAAR